MAKARWLRMNRETAARAERAAAAFYPAFWDGVTPDPAQGIIPATVTIAGATCAYGTATGLPYHNWVAGFGMHEPATAGGLALIREFMAPSRDWCLDLCPFVEQPEAVAELLSAAGLHPWRPSQELLARPADVPPPQDLPGVSVELATPPAAAEYARVGFLGFEIDPQWRELWFRAAANLLGKPDCYNYLVRVDGVPAAFGLLVVAGGVGYLAGAATLPEFRRRGLQSLLIRLRAESARAVGCDLLTVGTGMGTQSQWNLEAHGFRVVYSKTLWRLPPD